jgi:hypothetical protein
VTASPGLPVRAILAVAVIGGALGAVGCGSEPVADRAGTATFDTLPSGTVLVRNSGPAWGPGDAWTPVEVFRIGSADADDPYVFPEAWSLSLAIDSRDRIYVSDFQIGEVRLFAPDGTYLRTIARQGEGPGEVSQPVALAIDARDDLWIVDGRNRRYTVFDSAGALAAEYRRDEPAWGVPWRIGFGAGGQMYEAGSVPGAERGDRALALYAHAVSADGLSRDDETWVPISEEAPASFEIDYGDGSRAFYPIPFHPEPQWAFDGDNGIWSGDGAHYRLVHRSLAGDTLRVVELPDRAVPVDPSARDEQMDWLEGMPARLRDQVDLDRVPSTMTEYDRILVDDRGFVWVSAGWRPLRGSEEPATFDIFSPDGAYLGQLAFPFHPQPLPAFRGDLVVGITTDELDVPQIVGYRLQGRPAAGGP